MVWGTRVHRLMGLCTPGHAMWTWGIQPFYLMDQQEWDIIDLNAVAKRIIIYKTEQRLPKKCKDSGFPLTLPKLLQKKQKWRISHHHFFTQLKKDIRINSI